MSLEIPLNPPFSKGETNSISLFQHPARVWQAGEKEAEEDLKAGRIKTFDSVEDLIKDLEKE